MNMQFQQYDPHPLLKNYIEKIWVFNSSGPIPREDMKLIVPTGRIKLMIPFRNVATVKINGPIHQSPGNTITLIGLTDIPFLVNPEKDDPSGTIGIEFNARGAYRFFRLNYQGIKNQLHLFTDILGGVAQQLEEQVINAASASNKVALLQQFLIKQFWGCKEDPVFDFCVEKIRISKGRIPVNELERQTGYSSRWLNMKFLERAGISPKNLSAIIRFQEVYRALTSGRARGFDLYDYYYDQSHFIKDFKRFTGMPPVKLTKIVNDFGRQYHKG